MKKLLYLPLLLISFCSAMEVQKVKPNLREKQNLKTIVFDFDGTLADTLSIAIDVFNQLSDEYGYKPIKNIDDFKNKSLVEIIKQDLGVLPDQINSYIKKATGIMFNQINKANLFDGIPNTLSELSKNYEIAIISSNSKENISSVLEKNNIKNIGFIDSDSSISGKDETINHFMEKHNLKPQEIIYVGDEVRDIQACKKIGVKIIAVSWGYNSKEILDLEKPDYLVNKPHEIVDVLQKITGEL